MKSKMSGIHANNYSELFPTKFSAVIFVTYMGLFINQGAFSHPCPCTGSLILTFPVCILQES
jgi:hypothetical protein